MLAQEATEEHTCFQNEGMNQKKKRKMYMQKMESNTRERQR